MNAAFPTDPRQELEARIVALLLGEASPFEEAQLLRLIEQDPRLAAFYRDMQITVGLLREVAHPDVRQDKEAVASAAVPVITPKLSPARRTALLAALQTSPSPAKPPAVRGSVAATTARPSPATPWSKVWKRMRQPIRPELHWALKLAAVLALLAILSSLLLPALGTAKMKAASVAALNRKKMAEIEREMVTVRAEGRTSVQAAGAPISPAQPVQLQDGSGVAVAPAFPPPVDTPTSATSTRQANQVYLPAAHVEEQTTAELSDREKKFGDDRAMLAGQPAVIQPGKSFHFDAYTEYREGGGGSFGRTATAPAPTVQQPLPTLGDTRDATKRDALNGLINAGTPLNTLDNFQRQSGMTATWDASLPQQNLAMETARPGQSQTAATEQFWKELPSVNVMVNTVQSPGRAQNEPDYAGGEHKQRERTLREYTASETDRKRLADQDQAVQLERLARQTSELAQAAGWKAAAGGSAAPAPPPAPVRTDARRSEKAAEGKREVLHEQLEFAQARAPGATPSAASKDNTPPGPLPAAKPASNEPLDKRKAEAALPPLIHPPEVQTAPGSVLNFSTFSLNVSDVSFKTAAASLQAGQWPDPNSVRVEEFLNAFDYRDPAPAAGASLAFHWEMARHPFAHQRDLLRFSIKTAAQGRQAAQPLNLVVLLDNSGSMGRPDRVAIVSQSLTVLAEKLQPQDKLSVVAFARRARLCADGQPGTRAKEVLETVRQLNPEGGTDLGAGLDLAYQTALKHFLPRGNNRVLLLTDGAANLGDVDPNVLKQKVVAHRQKGVALDCFGVGWEGLDDDLLELLSRNGDGRHALLNDAELAGAEFADKLAGALNVAAADVKTQVEFNPHRVTAYRQIGYARHQLTREQFRDNTVDAAELAAAESGNALYVLHVNPQGTGPLGVVRVRYRIPATGLYEEREWVLPYQPQPPPLPQASPAMRLAATAALFGEYLARNPYAGEVNLPALRALATGLPEHFAPDPRPRELATMLQQAIALAGGK